MPDSCQLQRGSRSHLDIIVFLGVEHGQEAGVGKAKLQPLSHPCDPPSRGPFGHFAGLGVDLDDPVGAANAVHLEEGNIQVGRAGDAPTPGARAAIKEGPIQREPIQCLLGVPG